MRVVSLLFVFSSLFIVSDKEGSVKNQQHEQPKIPTTLSEAHAELERILSPQELAKIDAMPSEEGMIQYHMGLGASIRNRWGLWRASPLTKHMVELGFNHPDDMTGVILETFWCKRHGQDLRLEERAAAAKESMGAAQKARQEKENRMENARAAIQKMMMGLQFEERAVPTARIPTRRGLNVRFLCPFRDGVFLTAYCQGRMQNEAVVTEGYFVDPVDGERRTKPEYDDAVMRGFYFDRTSRKLRKMKPGEDFYTLGFYFDPKDCVIHEVRAAEVNEVYSAVVAGERAWFAGLTNGRTVLAGVNNRDRITVPLPQEDEIPDLGLDGQSLLAVYSKTIFRLTDRQWTLVHSGDILLPRSGLPPQRHGNMVFLRDEGIHEIGRRLWWLTLGERLHLSVLDRDIGVVVPDDSSLWQSPSSYCVTKSGDLWVCVGGGMSLLRRSKDGSYAIAIMNRSVEFTKGTLDSSQTDQAVSISAVTALSDDTLLLVGDTGLYRLKGNELDQELAFASQQTPDSSGRIVDRLDWNPNNVLVLDDQSYIISSGSWRGVCLLRKGNDGEWSLLALDEKRGDSVVW